MPTMLFNPLTAIAIVIFVAIGFYYLAPDVNWLEVTVVIVLVSFGLLFWQGY